MKVVLIRHAHAVEQDDAESDESRHLTSRGRGVARRVGERLLKDGVHFDTVLTSPLVRAVQTAELVVAGARFGGEVESTLGLAPGHSARRAAKELDGRGEVVVAVGHEPGISALAAHLAGQTSHPALRKGQVLIFEDGRLVYSLDPDTL